MREEFIWAQKYRPQTVQDTILPDDIKQTFQDFVDQKNIPNLLLSGSSGCGKTTIAKAMLEELGCDYIVINGSLNGNIDTLRNEILTFASSVSFTGGRKYVILDEADYLNPNSTQPSLRNFMEEYSSNCGFILTCNYPNKIIKELQGRCSIIEFKIQKKDLPKLAQQFMKRVCQILTAENIEYDKLVVAEVIKKYIPNWRRVLNELQRYSSSGKIDDGILSNFSEITLGKLVGYLKEKDFTSARKWVAENSDTDVSTIYRRFYDVASDYVEKSSVPMLVLILAKYQYQSAFAIDQEINLMACLTECMMELEYV
jgi:DNA polymerase III delta prime subunit